MKHYRAYGKVLLHLRPPVQYHAEDEESHLANSCADIWCVM